MTQVAIPLASVVPWHVSVPFKVKVTTSPLIGVPVDESVSTADTGVGEEKLPETGCTASVVGVAATVVPVVATLIWLFTDRPYRVPEWVEMVFMSAPVTMLIS